MLAIWSLVPLPFLKPTWATGSMKPYGWKTDSILLEAKFSLASPEEQYWSSPPSHQEGSPAHFPYQFELTIQYNIWWCYSFFLFYFIFKLYNIVLVLPNIEMNRPQVYMCSPSWTLLPPPSPYHPSGLSQCTSPSIEYRASNLDWRLVPYMILYVFQCHSPKSSHPLPLPQSP